MGCSCAKPHVRGDLSFASRKQLNFCLMQEPFSLYIASDVKRRPICSEALFEAQSINFCTCGAIGLITTPCARAQLAISEELTLHFFSLQDPCYRGISLTL